MVTVADSALGADAGGPCSISIAASRAVKHCCDRFAWGGEGAAQRQLAIALLLDVSGDAATALKWHEHFARTYVRNLPDAWVVPELDIALWLYCFENARPGS